MKEEFTVRKGDITDAECIASVNIQSWKETYPGIMPEEKLASIDLERCSNNWRKAFSEEVIILVAEFNKRVVGYISGGKNRLQEVTEKAESNNNDCEIYSLYILCKYHNFGVGKKLFTAFIREMQKCNYRTMAVWVAEKNPAVGFYKNMGGKQIDRQLLKVCKTMVPEICFQYVLSDY